MEQKKIKKEKKSEAESWDVEKVCKWIRRLDSNYENKKYDNLLKENEIDGITLIKMSKSDLKEMELFL